MQKGIQAWTILQAIRKAVDAWDGMHAGLYHSSKWEISHDYRP